VREGYGRKNGKCEGWVCKESGEVREIDMDGNGGSVRDGCVMQGVYIMDGSVRQVGKCEG
jgi:hypothetical protein